MALSPQLAEATRKAGAGALTALVSRMRGLDRVAWRGDLSAGRPDPRRVAQLAADLCANGCRQRRLAPAPRVALAVMVDTSSSMSRESVTGSEGCALALADAVRRCGGVAVVGSFHHELLAAGEQITVAREAYPEGGTPMSAGIGGALVALSTAEARRCHIRLMVVLSDGEPGDASETLELAKRARASGVQILGVFLSPKPAYASSPEAQRQARRVTSWRLVARMLWPVARDRAGWSNDTARRAVVEAKASELFPLDGRDPFEEARLDADMSRHKAARLSAALGGAPACCIDRAGDLAKAAVPALRALVSRWAGERV